MPEIQSEAKSQRGPLNDANTLVKEVDHDGETARQEDKSQKKLDKLALLYYEHYIPYF